MTFQLSFYQYHYKTRPQKKKIKFAKTDLFHEVNKYMTSMICYAQEIVEIETDYYMYVTANSFVSTQT